MNVTAGTKLGPYEIRSLIGRGGMGDVYRAQDVRLGRDVAVKLLNREGGRRTILDEARIIARLNHPHICTLFDVGDDFIVMELLHGVTLGAQIAAGPMRISDVITYSSQLADALALAHANGITHRDLKPSNIMLVRGGAKLLDFGIASANVDPSATTLTDGAQFFGTLLYMAPEQLTDGVTSPLSDIFSLGTVMYEMVAGQQPFRESAPQAIVGAIVRNSPTKLSEIRTDVPGGLEEIIKVCMRSDPSRRWQSASDLAHALRVLGDSKHRKVRKLTEHSPTQSRPIRTIRRIAVMPFENRSDNDQNFMAAGVAELIRFSLAHVSGLRVTAMSSSRMFGSLPENLQTVHRQLRVEAIVLGAVSRTGDRITVSCRMVAVPSGDQLWSATYEQNLGELSSVQRVIAESIAAELGIRLSPSRQQSTTQFAVAPKAQESYLKALYRLPLRTGESFRSAGELLNIAIQLSPDFALAHSALADWYLGMALDRAVAAVEALPQAKRSAVEALRLNPRLAHAHAVLGEAAMLEWDPHRAIRDCRTAIELDPNLSNGYLILGSTARALQRHDEAERFTDIAQQLDPLAVRTHLASIRCALSRGDYSVALERCEAAKLLPSLSGSSSPIISLMAGLAHFLTGKYVAAIDELRSAVARSKHPAPKVALASVLWQIRRDAGEVQQIVQELFVAATLAETTPIDFAELYAGLENPEQAVRYLQRALELRQPELIHILSEPLLSPLKGRDDFAAIIRAIGLESAVVAASEPRFFESSDSQ